MHQYLKSIGFGRIKTKKELKKILLEVEHDFTSHQLVALEEELDFCEYKKEYGRDIGIAEYGEMDMGENFEREYYFPYFIGSGITSYADIIVEKRIEKESYVGICEDIKVGVSIIFHLQNNIEYMREKQLGNLPKASTSVTLSGLALSGMILLPVSKNKDQERAKNEETRNRIMLLSDAKNVDPEAMESLTLDDIDTYSKVSKRLITEDVYTIVDTYFMPYGAECDQYSILGEILEVSTITNQKTEEELYIMTLDVNELRFDICMPKSELMGEPQAGRRFKGNVWLQGYINF
ncbi:MAG: DUF3881 family protein [Lachnospiraceae bacterium]